MQQVKKTQCTAVIATAPSLISIMAWIKALWMPITCAMSSMVFMAITISHIRIMWLVMSSRMRSVTGYLVSRGCTYLVGGPGIMGLFFWFRC